MTFVGNMLNHLLVQQFFVSFSPCHFHALDSSSVVTAVEAYPLVKGKPFFIFLGADGNWKAFF